MRCPVAPHSHLWGGGGGKRGGEGRGERRGNICIPKQQHITREESHHISSVRGCCSVPSKRGDVSSGSGCSWKWWETNNVISSMSDVEIWGDLHGEENPGGGCLTTCTPQFVLKPSAFHTLT